MTMSARLLAIEAGADPRDLVLVGEGMEGTTFRSGKLAYKVGRHGSLRDSADWLETASKSKARGLVARFVRFDDSKNVLVKAYVPGRPANGWNDAQLVRDTFEQISKAMLAKDWGMPEFKYDSFVIGSSGIRLVDSGRANRLFDRLTAYVEDVLAGRRSLGRYERYEDLAFYVRRELGEDEGGQMDRNRAMRALERLYELGAPRELL